MTNLKEVAEKILGGVRYDNTCSKNEYGHWIEKIESILRELVEEIEEEALNYAMHAKTLVALVTQEDLKEARSAARAEAISEAADMAFAHWCDKDCDVDAQIGGGGCASQIAAKIRAMGKV